MAALMTISQAAKVLGCGRTAIKRRIKEGILHAGQLPGSGSTSPTFVDARQIYGMVRCVRDLEAFEPKTPYQDREYQARYAELARRVKGLQERIGAQPILDVLSVKYGITDGKMWRLHPEDFAKFRGDLIVLARGNRPKYRNWKPHRVEHTGELNV